MSVCYNILGTDKTMFFIKQFYDYNSIALLNNLLLLLLLLNLLLLLLLLLLNNLLTYLHFVICFQYVSSEYESWHWRTRHAIFEFQYSTVKKCIVKFLKVKTRKIQPLNTVSQSRIMWSLWDQVTLTNDFCVVFFNKWDLWNL